MAEAGAADPVLADPATLGLRAPARALALALAHGVEASVFAEIPGAVFLRPGVNLAAASAPWNGNVGAGQRCAVPPARARLESVGIGIHERAVQRVRIAIPALRILDRSGEEGIDAREAPEPRRVEPRVEVVLAATLRVSRGVSSVLAVAPATLLALNKGSGWLQPLGGAGAHALPFRQLIIFDHLGACATRRKSYLLVACQEKIQEPRAHKKSQKQ